MIGTAVPVSSATPNPVLSAFIPARTQPHRPSKIVGDGVRAAPATDGIWMVASAKFSLVGIVFFVGAADQLSKKIELMLSYASRDQELAVITTRQPRLIKCDLCANGIG